MSFQQPLFSPAKLLYRILSKKKSKLEAFEPFSVQFQNIYANDKHLQRFIFSFGDPNDIPTFAFITGFKPILQCFSQSKTPSSIMGLIHLSSEFRVHHKHNWYLPHTLKVTVAKCEKSDKGLIYTIHSDFYQMGKLTVSNTNTMLDKNKKYKSDKIAEASSKQEPSVSSPFANWSIKLKTAWHYAKLSGDFNPIHLHPILAKQFGLKSVLIHGMYNASQTIKQVLEKEQNKINQGILIEFNKPCFIPADVFLRRYENNQDTHDKTDSTYGLFSRDGKDRYLKLSYFSE